MRREPRVLSRCRQGRLLYPRAVAFDPTGEFLAVGVEEANELPKKSEPFARVTGGKVYVYAEERLAVSNGT